MNKILKRKDFIIFVVAVCFVLFFLRIGSYLIMDFFQESKYMASMLEMTGLKSLFLPLLNGDILCGGGILYYFVLKLFSFYKLSEFSLRLPTVLCFMGTLLYLYYILYKFTNKNFSLISVLTLFSCCISMVFATISNPNMFSALALLLAVFTGCRPVFTQKTDGNKYFFGAFWLFTFCGALFGKLLFIFLPFLIVLPCLFFTKNIREFFRLKNFLPGLCFVFVCMALYLFAGYKTNGADFIYFIKLSLLPQFQNINSEMFCYYFKNFAVYFLFGLLPWVFYILPIVITLLINLAKDKSLWNRNLMSFFDTEENKFLLVSLWGFICCLIYYFVFLFNDFSGIISAVFFVALAISFFLYKNIFSGEYKKTVLISSFLFYLSLLLLTAGLIISFFVITPLQKVYIEPLIIPIMTVTLLVAVPGFIAVALKRTVLNFGIHIFFSVLFFFLLTGLFYNYINSFGENDLVNFAVKAKQDEALLVTYDLKNKYVLPFYYGNAVIFNKNLEAEEIYNNYGDSRNVYIVLKHKDLAYFDMYFVYEIVATGKQYSEITNIKYLPEDEVETNLSEKDEDAVQTNQ